MRNLPVVIFAWLLAAGVFAQAESLAASGAQLDIQRTCSLEKSWNDKRSGADLDGFFYIPFVDSSEFIIGGYGTQKKKLTDEDCVLTVGTSENLVAPIAWELIWLDKGSGARLDGSMWRAIPPSEDYRCIGTIPQIDYENPGLTNYRCVPAELTEKVVTSTVIWTDKGSGAKKPVSIFKLPHSGSFVAVPGRLAQIEAYDLKLSPPTATASEEIESTAPLGAATQAEEIQPDPDVKQPQDLPGAMTVETTVLPDMSVLERQALALRQSAIDRGDMALRVLDIIPGIGWLLPQDVSEVDRIGILKQLWGSFFENAVVEIRDEETESPSVLYYNPLLDVALLTHWERPTILFHRIKGLRVLPGERLSTTDTVVSAAPGWMTGETPIETLYNTTRERLSAFKNSQIPEYERTDDQRYELAVRDLRLAQPRLEWNMLQRAQWHGESNGWLSGTIAAIEETLSLGDATALLTRAVETEMETAMALVNLPEGFVDSLTLDMVLNYEGEDRLLVISLPEDGNVYIMAQCHLIPDAQLCLPRKYFLFGFGIDEGGEV